MTDAEFRTACKEGNASVVDQLIKKGANVNSENRAGQRPLHIAASVGNAEIVEVLIKNGASVNAAQKSGDAAIHFAAVGGFTTTVQSLINGGADVNLQNSDGFTALHIACKESKPEIVQLLLANGIDTEIKAPGDKLALQLATTNDIKELFKAPRPQVAPKPSQPEPQATAPSPTPTPLAAPSSVQPTQQLSQEAIKKTVAAAPQPVVHHAPVQVTPSVSSISIPSAAPSDFVNEFRLMRLELQQLRDQVSLMNMNNANGGYQMIPSTLHIRLSNDRVALYKFEGVVSSSQTQLNPNSNVW